MNKINCIVFRDFTYDGTFEFTQMDIVGDQLEFAESFQVEEGDTYLDLTFSHIVFCESANGATVEWARIHVVNREEQQPEIISKLDKCNLEKIVQHFLSTLIEENEQ